MTWEEDIRAAWKARRIRDVAFALAFPFLAGMTFCVDAANSNDPVIRYGSIILLVGTGITAIALIRRRTRR